MWTWAFKLKFICISRDFPKRIKAHRTTEFDNLTFFFHSRSWVWRRFLTHLFSLLLNNNFCFPNELKFHVPMTFYVFFFNLLERDLLDSNLFCTVESSNCNKLQKIVRRCVGKINESSSKQEHLISMVSPQSIDCKKLWIEDVPIFIIWITNGYTTGIAL